MPRLVGTRKAFNASCDVDLLNAATARLKLLGLDRSAFIEQQFAALLAWSDPLVAVLESGRSEAEMKVVLRSQLSNVQNMLSHAHGDMADLMAWSVEDSTHSNE
jgi:hypothetical protein